MRRFTNDGSSFSFPVEYVVHMFIVERVKTRRIQASSRNFAIPQTEPSQSHGKCSLG